MSQASHGVHRCPSCDELAEAEYGENGAVVCLNCGYQSQRKVPPVRKGRLSGVSLETKGLVQRDVVAKRQSPTDSAIPVSLPEAKVPPEAEDPNSEPIQKEYRGRRIEDEIVSEDGEKKVVRRRKRKRKLRLGRVVFVLVWLVLALFLFQKVIKSRMKGHSEGGEKSVQAELEQLEELRAREAEAYIKKHMPECREVLSRFLAAPDVSARAPYVRGEAKLVPIMANYYRQNSAYRPVNGLIPEDTNLVLHGDLRAIETSWTSEGERLEVVFVREAGAWKIDWKSFVRYSTTPWHLFLSEIGASEGTFRVYARVKEASFSEDGKEVMSLRLYPPLQDQLLRNRGSSDAVLVTHASESGRRIKNVVAFKERELEVGDRKFQLIDPEALHRMRVALEWREGTEGKRYLHLNEVFAGNWLGEGFEEDFGEADEELSFSGEGVVR